MFHRHDHGSRLTGSLPEVWILGLGSVLFVMCSREKKYLYRSYIANPDRSDATNHTFDASAGSMRIAAFICQGHWISGIHRTASVHRCEIYLLTAAAPVVARDSLLDGSATSPGYQLRPWNLSYLTPIQNRVCICT